MKLQLNIYSNIVTLKAKGKKQFAVLIDPDKINQEQLREVCRTAAMSKVDYFFIGSSILTNGNLSQCIKTIKDTCPIPIILFPGNTLQVCDSADALLFLSLISGRNAEMLIGNHVISAPMIKQSKLEVISTGYMLIEGGSITSVQYISNTTPIPRDKKDIACCTALAGEMLGMKMIFMDAGSGAKVPVSKSMIQAVRQTINVPLIVGGGINTPALAIESCEAGADMIVVGNSIEQDVTLIERMADAIHSIPVIS